jgi:signal peptidase
MGRVVKTGEKPQATCKPTGVRGIVIRVCNVLSLSILILIVIVAAGLLAAQALGFKPMAVLSGSMEPAYATGSVVFVDTNADVESVSVGDVVTYSLSGGTTVVTHRVIAIDEKKGLFTTKGDANEFEDGPVPYGSFIGRTAGFYIPFAGSILLMVGTTQGIAVALFFLAFIVVLLMVPVILTPSKPAVEPAKPLVVTIVRDSSGNAAVSSMPSVRHVEPAKPVVVTIVREREKDGVRGAHFRVPEQGTS